MSYDDTSNSIDGNQWLVWAMPVPAAKLLLNLVGIVVENWTSAEEVRL